ncbi:MAG: rod shape-determining protein MreD [Candidatus Marinimicrobia bacterium]|jgi:rod shape-determining protein MreD|nr:rod shape-determining protein MreD [Candidatus Neomarinimicrobiota bacterium]MBT3630305.1 rod shape-determining protein MreD [Candidatus Neomarinimicrobiota bacterium]MBT3824057.1 rod shape-determining protein MreD [Candidatus Neomarinimicrobiota bacterium]MBT4132344.1 rod shape-determining protein MreD [Candidatus Neomarinimicrobiota bacterium]MBT4296385.1 rod shape-determining protein MreD [Candidatus Neomarinimicrobiota bacterium]
MFDIIKYSIFGLLVLIFQWMLGDIFSIYGLTPSFLVIFIIYVGLTHSQLNAIWLGFFLGFIIDALTGTDMMGLTALALSTVGYLSGIFHGRIVRIPVIVQYLLYAGFLLVFFIITVMISLQDSQFATGNIVFLILLPKTLYTMALLSGSFIVLRVGAE